MGREWSDGWGWCLMSGGVVSGVELVSEWWGVVSWVELVSDGWVW